MNLDLFFECDVFFLGTARNIDSQISDTNDGILNWTAEGMSDREIEGAKASRRERGREKALDQIVWDVGVSWVANNCSVF